jgi:DNA-binding GntR family transcriptional regulator
MNPAMIERLRRLQNAVSAEIELLEDNNLDGAEEAAFNSRVTRANELFHAEINRAAGNARLATIISDLQGYFPKDYVWRATRHGPEARVLGVDNHDDILVALEAHDGDAARTAMTEHINFARRLLLDYLDEHRFWSS